MLRPCVPFAPQNHVISFQRQNGLPELFRYRASRAGRVGSGLGGWRLRPRCVGSSTPMSTALIALRCRTTPCHGAVLSAEYGAELSAETDSDRQLPDNILRRGQTTSYSCPRVSSSFTTPQIYATTNPLVEEKTIPFRSGSLRTPVYGCFVASKVDYTKLEMRGRAQRVALPAQTGVLTGLNWTDVHQIFSRRREVDTEDPPRRTLRPAL